MTSVISDSLRVMGADSTRVIISCLQEGLLVVVLGCLGGGGLSDAALTTWATFDTERLGRAQATAVILADVAAEGVEDLVATSVYDHLSEQQGGGGETDLERRH